MQSREIAGGRLIGRYSVRKSLPDPLPEDPKAIVRAFRQDPDLPMLDNPNAYNVLKSIVDRCRYNRWPVPPAVKNLLGWSALYMKWHWHCIAGRKISATEGEAEPSPKIFAKKS